MTDNVVLFPGEQHGGGEAFSCQPSGSRGFDSVHFGWIWHHGEEEPCLRLMIGPSYVDYPASELAGITEIFLRSVGKVQGIREWVATEEGAGDGKPPA